MKKFYPYILPTVALLTILIMLIRWYANQTKENDLEDINTNTYDVETLNDDELKNLRNSSNLKFSKFTNVNEKVGSGEVMYNIKDDKVVFSVSADLPKDNSYEVWIVPNEGMPTKAFDLDYGKGGFFGNGSISSKALPFDVVVVQSNGESSYNEANIVLKATIKNED